MVNMHVFLGENSAAGAVGGTSTDERPASKKSKGHWARDVSAYDILEPIGEGTYGKVRQNTLPKQWKYFSCWHMISIQILCRFFTDLPHGRVA